MPVTDETTRAGIEAAIAALRTRARRLPAHWVDEQQAISDECDRLVDLWIGAAG